MVAHVYVQVSSKSRPSGETYPRDADEQDKRYSQKKTLSTHKNITER